MALRALQGPTGGGAPVGGTGTTNTIPRWTGPSTLGDSVITQDTTTGVNIRVNAATSVYATANRTALELNGTTSSLLGFAVGGVASGYLTASASSMLLTAGASRPLQLGASNAIGMTFDTSNNVGIGTASPWAKTAMVATNNVSTISFGFSFDSANNYRHGISTVFSSSNTAGNMMSFCVSDTTATGFTRVLTLNGAGQAALGTTSFTSGCSLTVAQSIDVSQSAQGVKLQGTAGTNNTDPNVLDFYADGGTANSGGVTWTPAVTFGGASTGVTYSTQVGRYTRIGNMVCATCYVVLSSKGTATGNVKITGLPTSSNTSNLFTAATVGYFANITSTGQVMGYMSPNDTGVILNQTTPVGSSSALTDANFANNSTFIMTIAYPVT